MSSPPVGVRHGTARLLQARQRRRPRPAPGRGGQAVGFAEKQKVAEARGAGPEVRGEKPRRGGSTKGAQQSAARGVGPHTLRQLARCRLRRAMVLDEGACGVEGAHCQARRELGRVWVAHAFFRGAALTRGLHRQDLPSVLLPVHLSMLTYMDTRARTHTHTRTHARTHTHTQAATRRACGRTCWTTFSSSRTRSTRVRACSNSRPTSRRYPKP